MDKIVVGDLEQSAEHIGNAHQPCEIGVVLQKTEGFAEHGASEGAENRKQQKPHAHRARVCAVAAYHKKAYNGQERRTHGNRRLQLSLAEPTEKGVKNKADHADPERVVLGGHGAIARNGMGDHIDK